MNCFHTICGLKTTLQLGRAMWVPKKKKRNRKGPSRGEGGIEGLTYGIRK